jgi:uncharacterized protein (UPF0335 family)
MIDEYQKANVLLHKEVTRLRDQEIRVDGITDRIESKVKAIFNEAERMNFDDSAIYSVLNDLKTAIFNAIRRG